MYAADMNEWEAALDDAPVADVDGVAADSQATHPSPPHVLRLDDTVGDTAVQEEHAGGNDSDTTQCNETAV